MPHQVYPIVEKAAGPFNFQALPQAYGWLALAPFAWDAGRGELSHHYDLGHGTVVELRLRGLEDGVEGEIMAPSPLPPEKLAVARRAVRRMVRLDEDLTPFHELRARLPHWPLRLPPGGGRIIRAPDLFQDIAYTLCTTNITWSGTKRMVSRLVEALGASFDGAEGGRAFPTAQALAAAGPERLRREAGLGYRSPYLAQLAEEVAGGRRDLAWLEEPESPTEEVYRALLQIKGIGPYAAATILKLLGRYEVLAVDSEMRAFAAAKYGAGNPLSDAEIAGIYAPWGKWQQLAYWFDTPPAAE